MSPLSLIDSTAEQISEAVIAIGEEQTGLRNRAPTGVLRGIWETIALVIGRIYAAHATPMYAQADRATATGPWLRMHAAYLDVQPQGATAAHGSLQALSPASSQTVAAGTAVTVKGAAVFTVDQAVELPAGIAAALPVTATALGPSGNVAPGAEVALTGHPDVAVSVPIGWLAMPGAAAESDDRLRARIDDRWHSLGDGYPPAQYRFIAEAVPGVRRAIVVRAPRGWGSADVVVVANDDSGVPSPALLAAVTAALDQQRMICRDLRVVGGAIVPVRIHVLYAGPYQDSQVADAIRQRVAAATSGDVLRVADIYAAAAALDGLEYFGVVSPLHDVSLGSGGQADISVVAEMGRLPATQGAGGTGPPAGQPITAALPFGILRGDGSLHEQPAQAPIASGRWVLSLPPLAAAGEAWYIGPLPAGATLSAIDSYGADVTADWAPRSDGVYLYRSAATVPPGVAMDVEVTATS